MSKREWTDEQRQAASDRMKQRHGAGKTADVKKAMRVPIGGARNITNVNDTPDGFVDRWVNDNDGRIERFRRAGYENVSVASVGDSGVDATHAEAGAVSKDMGKGVTAYLMRQREDFFKEDQAAKQVRVDASEDSIRRDVKEKLSSDGHYGEVKISRR